MDRDMRITLGRSLGGRGPQVIASPRSPLSFGAPPAMPREEALNSATESLNRLKTEEKALRVKAADKTNLEFQQTEKRRRHIARFQHHLRKEQRLLANEKRLNRVEAQKSVRKSTTIDFGRFMGEITQKEESPALSRLPRSKARRMAPKKLSMVLRETKELKTDVRIKSVYGKDSVYLERGGSYSLKSEKTPILKNSQNLGRLGKGAAPQISGAPDLRKMRRALVQVKKSVRRSMESPHNEKIDLRPEGLN